MTEQAKTPDITDIGEHPGISWDRRMEMGSFEPHPREIPVTDHNERPVDVNIRNIQPDQTVVDFTVTPAEAPTSIAAHAME